MRYALLTWICCLFLVPVVLPGYAIADQPDLERIPEILAEQRSKLATAKVYQPETSGIRTRSPVGPQLYKSTVAGTVMVLTKLGYGSGVQVAKGMILTNWHVVEGEKHAAILFWKPELTDLSTLSKKDLVPALVLETDPTRDLAVLIVDPSKVPTYAKIIKSARLSDVSIGQDVYAIGHPVDLLWSYTEGVVSHIRPNYAWKYESSKHRASVIQTQTPISYGSSGGPLFDQKGRLIGLNTLGSEPGFNFAVAIDEVTTFVFNVISRLKK